MLGLQASGPMRLRTPAVSCSRRCGARPLAIAPGWRRAGALLLPPNVKRDVSLQAKRGRPPKLPDTDEAASTPTDADAEASDPASGKKRGRRSRKEKAQEEARDLLESQQVDLEVLEQFKARAAEEERLRRETIGDTGEDDPRRLNFHRSLLAASARGLTDECARIIDSMADAGLTPGPRAIHVWAYSYIKLGDGSGAKRVAEQAKEIYGVSWIPETYVALMHGALNCNRAGPDLMTALTLWVEQQDAGANPQVGFAFLAKELFRLRFSALAMQVVSEGYAAGYQPDEKLAALVIEQLCKQGLMTEARAEMQRLLDAGSRVGPDHYDTIIRLEAAGGNLQTAREMLQTYYNNPGQYLPPRTSSYTALIKGLASSLRLRGGPNDEATEVEAEAESRPRKLDVAPEQLESTMSLLREEMVSRGLRPGRDTYAAMVEATSAVGDFDSALSHYETMTRAKGTPALLRKKYLGHFVVSMLVADRPIDALRVLRDCAAAASFTDALSRVTLPPSAAAPLPGPEYGGRSAVTAWLPAHHDAMRKRRGQRASVSTFFREADLASRREVDGVVLGLGGCVVTEDGLFVPPTKMTLTELRVELTAAGIEVPPGASGRRELTRLVKERRAELPSSVMDMQAQLAAMVAAREEAEEEAVQAEAMAEAAKKQAEAVAEGKRGAEGEDEYDDDEEDDFEELDETIVDIIVDEATFEGGESLEDSATFRAASGGKLLMRGVDERPLQDEKDEEDDAVRLRTAEDDAEDEDEDPYQEFDAEDMEEAFGDDDPKGRKKRRGRPRAGGEEDAEDDEDDDEAAVRLEDAPPLTDGLGPVEGVGPDDLDWDLEGQEEEDDDVILDQILNMNVFDSSRYNEGAGMHVAVRLLSVWVTVGCIPTPADLVALYEAATVEEHPCCAADVAEQLPLLAKGGHVTAEQLTEMLVTLANVCLQPGAPDADAADRVVTLMEDNGLEVPADVYTALDIALNGKGRMRDVAEGSRLGLSVEGLTDTDADEVLPLAALAMGGAAEPTVVEAAAVEAAAEEAEEVEAEEEAEEGGEEEEGEEAFAEYEDDPAQLEVERAELERLFQQDGAEEDAWLDELDEEPADVASMRAAAAAEAAQAAIAEVVVTTLKAVHARNPRAAALLASRLAGEDEIGVAASELTEETLAGALAAAVEETEEVAGLLATGEEEQETGLVRVGGGALDALDAEEQGEGEATPEQVAAAFEYELLDAAAEAEWDAASLMELPPNVLAQAADGTLAELEERGELTEEDRALLASCGHQARLLAELAGVSAAAAAMHPNGPEAAAAQQADAISRISRTAANDKLANELLVAAVRAHQEGTPMPPEPPELPEDEAAELDELVDSFLATLSLGRGVGEEGEEGEEEEEEEEEDGPDLEALLGGASFEDDEDDEVAEEGEEDGGFLRLKDLRPGVDDGALGTEEQQRLHALVEAADALLAEEEEEERQRRAEAGEQEEEVVEVDPSDPAGQEEEEWDTLLEDAADRDARAEALQVSLMEAMSRGDDLTPEEQTLKELLVKGDFDTLEQLVGLDGIAWMVEEMRQMAEEQGIDVYEGTEPQPDEADDALLAGLSPAELSLAELVPDGFCLKESFVDRFRAVLKERAEFTASQPGPRDPDDDAPEVVMMEVLQAMADGYKLQEEEEAEARAAEEGKEDEEFEQDPDLDALRQEVQRAVRTVEAAQSGEAAVAAQRELQRSLQRHIEALEARRKAEGADEDEEEAAEFEEAEEGYEGEAAYEGEEGDEAEEGEGYERGLRAAIRVTARPKLDPEVAAGLLAVLRKGQPGGAQPFVGGEEEEEEEEEEEGQEAPPLDLKELTAARLKAQQQQAVEEPQAEQDGESGAEERPSGGRGRGRSQGAGGRGRKGTR